MVYSGDKRNMNLHCLSYLYQLKWQMLKISVQGDIRIYGKGSYLPVRRQTEVVLGLMKEMAQSDFHNANTTLGDTD